MNALEPSLRNIRNAELESSSNRFYQLADKYFDGVKGLDEDSINHVITKAAFLVQEYLSFNHTEPIDFILGLPDLRR